MGKPVIKVEHLGKTYRISSRDIAAYRSIREELVQAFSVFKKSNSSKSKTSTFHALQDLSFSVDEGSVLGLIGRNGAGKSTLLKLLGRITEPSSGKIKLKDRVMSLLEVGTGFHPELTGRENIFLSGAILGMKRQEVRRSFDEIVQFAGVEKFLDTPVKRYSSGMFVRLGFAIAAHLQAEILLIDEVLAVGDIEFQKRCLGKIGEVAKGGRTVLFVSHNLGAIEQLCDSAMVLEKGKLAFLGSISEALRTYRQVNKNAAVRNFISEQQVIKKVSIYSEKPDDQHFTTGSALHIDVTIRSERVLQSPVLGIVIRDHYNVPMIGINNRHYKLDFENVRLKSGMISIRIPHLPLVAGAYSIDLFLGDIHGDFEVLEHAIDFLVDNTGDQFVHAKLDRRLNRVFVKNVNWEIRTDGI